MKNSRSVLILVAGLVVGMGNAVCAEEAVLGASHDSWVDGFTPEANYGAANPMRLKYQNATWGNGYSMFKFDLSALPEDIIINSARIGFFTALGSWPEGGTNFSPVAIFNNTQDWDESTVTFSTAPTADATATETSDHFGLPSNPVFFTGTNSITAGGWLFYQNSNTLALVQGWVDGSVSNYGVSVMGTGAFVDSGRIFLFTSSEAGFAAARPQLSIAYSLANNYAGWAGGWGIDIGSETNDYDSDGLLNVYEFGMGGDPTNALDQGTSPVFGIVDVGGSNEFVYVHPQLSDPGSGLNYFLELRSDLLSGIWTNTGYTITGTNVTGGALDFVTNATDVAADKKFIRLIIE